MIHKVTLENGKIIYRKSLTEPSSAEPACGNTIQSEKSSKSKMWFRSRYGLDDPHELLPGGCVLDSLISRGIVPRELSNEFKHQHLFKKTPLLIWNVVKQFIKSGWCHKVLNSSTNA